MAGNIKKKSTNILVWVLMLLLVLGLGGFGVSNFGGATLSIATVGDTEINANDYARELRQELSAYQATIGQPLPLAQAIQFGLDHGVRDRMITAATLDNEATAIGLSVGDEQVKSEILAIPAFRGLDGTFDREAYRFTLDRTGRNEAGFEDDIRTETSRALLQSAIANGVASPDTMTNAFFNFTEERRDVSWILLTINDLPTQIPAPTDEEINAYYLANAAEFTAPEKKSISYVWLSPDMVIDDVTVEEDKVVKLYEGRAAEFIVPEKRLVERLVFPNAEDAATAKAQLDSGEATFQSLVTARGLALADIDLGDVTVKDLKDAGATIFAMDGPGVVGPIETSLGPALYRMNGILAAQNVSLEEARPMLMDELAADAARRQVSSLITDIDDLLAGGATLQEIANETDMQLATTEWWADSEDSINGYDAFREAADAVNDGDFAEVLELADGGIFALQLDGVIAPALKPLDDVVASVISGWESEESESRLNALADSVLPRLAEGGNMDSLGYPVTVETALARNGHIQSAPTGLIGQVFEMDKSETRTIDGFGTVYVLRVDDILGPDAEDPELDTRRDALADQIEQSLAQDVFAAFASTLQNDAGISLNTTVIDAVHAQLPQ